MPAKGEREGRAEKPKREGFQVIAKFWGLGGQCDACQQASPTAQMFDVGAGNARDAFICHGCARELVVKLGAIVPAVEAAAWTPATPRERNDFRTWLGWREGWSEPRAVSSDGRFWVDVTNGGVILAEQSEGAERRPPTWISPWPTGPRADWPAVPQGKAAQ